MGFYIAMPLLPYREPKIYKSLDKIPKLLNKNGFKKVLLVTDKGIRLTKPLEESLEAAGIECFVYDETVPNPTIDNVEAARKLYLDNDCKAIISFGGGSAMDCAKACGARIAAPNKSLVKMEGILKIHRRLPMLIAIPTTAGTGSETTVAAVITDAKTHHKYPINDFCMIPRYAVLDASVTYGLPKHITSTTGMDALTHAVEAYIGKSTTRKTRKWSEDAVCLIHDNLLKAYENGHDKEARENMLLASYYAGAAFTRSYVGYVHAIAHSLGGMYGTPHGLANSVILPIMLREYGEACYSKLAKLAKVSGVAKGDANDKEAAVAFIDWIQEMNDTMGIPRGIPEIKEEDIPSMSANADKEGNPLYPVPVLMDRKKLASMYLIIRDHK